MIAKLCQFLPPDLPLLPVWLVLAALGVAGVLYVLASRMWKVSLTLGAVVVGALLGRYWLLEWKVLHEAMAAMVLGGVILGVVVLALARWALGMALGITLGVWGVLILLATQEGKPVTVELAEGETWVKYFSMWRKVLPDSLVMSLGVVMLAGMVAGWVLVKFAERHAVAVFWPAVGTLVAAVAGVVWSVQSGQAWLGGALGTRGDVAGVVLGTAVVVGYAINLRPVAGATAAPAAAPASAAAA